MLLNVLFNAFEGVGLPEAGIGRGSKKISKQVVLDSKISNDNFSLERLFNNFCETFQSKDRSRIFYRLTNSVVVSSKKKMISFTNREIDQEFSTG